MIISANQERALILLMVGKELEDDHPAIQIIQDLYEELCVRSRTRVWANKLLKEATT